MENKIAVYRMVHGGRSFSGASEQRVEITGQLIDVVCAGVDVGIQMIIRIQALKNAVGVGAGQQADTEADCTQQNGQDDNGQDDTPSSSHSSDTPFFMQSLR